MILRSLAVLLAALWAAPAFAQLPEPLDRALSVIPEDISPEAFVLRMGVGSDAIRVGGSFSEGEADYRLIEPASEALLSEQQADLWEGFNRDEEDAPEAEADGSDEAAQSASIGIGSYEPDALRAAIGDTAELIEEGPERLVYTFTPTALPGQEGAPDSMTENLTGEVVVDPVLGQLVSVRFMLEESFKPNVSARLETFELEQRFVHEPVLNGPRMSAVRMSMSGSAFFRAFQQTMEMDIEEPRYPQPRPQPDSAGG